MHGQVVDPASGTAVLSQELPLSGARRLLFPVWSSIACGTSPCFVDRLTLEPTGAFNYRETGANQRLSVDGLTFITRPATPCSSAPPAVSGAAATVCTVPALNGQRCPFSCSNPLLIATRAYYECVSGTWSTPSCQPDVPSTEHIGLPQSSAVPGFSLPRAFRQAGLVVLSGHATASAGGLIGTLPSTWCPPTTVVFPAMLGNLAPATITVNANCQVLAPGSASVSLHGALFVNRSCDAVVTLDAAGSFSGSVCLHNVAGKLAVLSGSYTRLNWSNNTIAVLPLSFRPPATQTFTTAGNTHAVSITINPGASSVVMLSPLLSLNLFFIPSLTHTPFHGFSSFLSIHANKNFFNQSFFYFCAPHPAQMVRWWKAGIRPLTVT